MTLLYFFLIVGAIIVGVAAIFHKGMRTALKGGAAGVAVVVAASFVYGLFHDFSLWHGYGEAGLDAGIGYAALLGFTCGPVAFVVGAFATALVRLPKLNTPPTDVRSGQEPPV